MSYVSSLTASSSLYATVATTTTNSLRAFANLDLSEDQRTQIRAIFQQAKSQGLSQTQVQQAINAVLTPAQQQTLQNDIQQQAQTQTQSSTQSTPPNPFTDPNGPFANLNLTSSQQSQIAKLLQTAQSTGLSISQLNAQINAVLTPAQQSTFTTDLQNLPQPGSQPNASSSTDATTTDPLSNLALTDAQKSQIDSILQQAQNGTITQQQALTQITSILTPAQQTLLQQDEQTAQTSASGHHHHHHGGGGGTSTSTATLPNGVTETDIQNQVAAATSIILNNLQADVTSTT